MNNKQHPAAASRVLNCINQMLAIYFWKTALEPSMPKSPHLEVAYVALENACVDSSLFALRAFDDFIRSSRNRKDDLIASDFPGLLISCDGIDLLERTKINKYIAHLTHLDLELKIRSYSYHSCLSVVIEPAIEFCAYVIEHLPNLDGLRELASGTREACESVCNNYISR